MSVGHRSWMVEKYLAKRLKFRAPLIEWMSKPSLMESLVLSADVVSQVAIGVLYGVNGGSGAVWNSLPIGKMRLVFGWLGVLVQLLWMGALLLQAMVANSVYQSGRESWHGQGIVGGLCGVYMIQIYICR